MKRPPPGALLFPLLFPLLGAATTTTTTAQEPQSESLVVPNEDHSLPAARPPTSKQQSPHAPSVTPPRSSAGKGEARLNRAEIEQLAESFLPEIRACYSRQLDDFPTLKGTLVIQFQIGANGKVLRSDIRHDTLKSSAIFACISDLYRAERFTIRAGVRSAGFQSSYVFKGQQTQSNNSSPSPGESLSPGDDPPALNVEVGPVQLLGSLSRREIQRKLSEVKFHIQACYDRSLTENPSLKGSFVVSFTIDRTGRVRTLKAGRDEVGSPALAQCILGAIRHLKFPRPRGGGFVSVNYPYRFDPGIFKKTKPKKREADQGQTLPVPDPARPNDALGKENPEPTIFDALWNWGCCHR